MIVGEKMMKGRRGKVLEGEHTGIGGEDGLDGRGAKVGRAGNGTGMGRKGKGWERDVRGKGVIGRGGEMEGIRGG